MARLFTDLTLGMFDFDNPNFPTDRNGLSTTFTAGDDVVFVDHPTVGTFSSGTLDFDELVFGAATTTVSIDAQSLDIRD